MKLNNVEDVYPLSPLQMGMLFHTLYAPESGTYCDQMSWTIHGELDVEAYERAWRRLIQNHAIFRTAFLWEDLSEPLQVVRGRVELPWKLLDWRGLSRETQQERLISLQDDDLKLGFRLSQAPLMRCILIRLEDELYRFVWSYHHILLDGWSLSLIFREVHDIYEANRLGVEAPPNEELPYRNYIAWLRSQNVMEAEAFWRETLKGFTEPSSILVDNPRETANHRPEAYESHRTKKFSLSESISGKLTDFAKRQQLTANTLIHGAWALLLSYYSGKSDVLFGTTVSGRPPALEGVEEMVGMFINTLPIRVEVRTDAEVVVWLKNLQDRLARVRQYEYSSLIQIQGWSDAPRGRALFESILVFENTPTDRASRKREIKAEIYDLVHSEARTGYPLTLMVFPGSELSFHMTYDSSRFDSSVIDRICDHLRNILESMTEGHKHLTAVSLLTKSERSLVLHEWGSGEVTSPPDRRIHQIIENQVERAPDAIAAVFGHEHLSYFELNDQASRLARRLTALGVEPEGLVGIFLERSLKMLVGLLGVLKAGGAYLPLDPRYPIDRLTYMIADGRPQVLLTESELAGKLNGQTVDILCLDFEDAETELTTFNRGGNPVGELSADHTAYVIYTSGSTGKPKGVQITHRNVVNLLRYMGAERFVVREDILLAITTLSFDIAALEMFLPLFVGARLVIAGNLESADGALLAGKLRQCQATVIQATPATWRLLSASDWGGDQRLQPLKAICGGEVLDRDLADQIQEKCPILWNVYGPTETTIWSVSGRVVKGLNPVAIGRPVSNTQTYLLNKDHLPVPIGLPGELFIGGGGVARGYLNRPDLTAEKFIADPLGGEAGSRLYRTGDLARYRYDGEIEFLGRIDHQVKIRGHRIEPGEIEAALRSHGRVEDALVLSREDTPGDQRLIAYVVSAADLATQIEELRGFLRKLLPEQMIPSAFISLDSLPRTPNGKVDRAALLAPDRTRPCLDTLLIGPSTAIQETLVKIFEQVLEIDRVGIHDDFFTLGGHSLLATRVISKLREAFQVEVGLQQLFDRPTVALLSETIENLKSAGRSAPNPPPLPIKRVSRASYRNAN